MTPANLLAQLERLDIKASLAGDKLHVEAPAGALTPELKDALRQHKAELLALLRQRGIPRVISNIFCFTCFRAGGKAARYQPHTVARYAWQGDSDWWELTCTRCGSRCYMRPTNREVTHHG